MIGCQICRLSNLSDANGGSFEIATLRMKKKCHFDKNGQRLRPRQRPTFQQVEPFWHIFVLQHLYNIFIALQILNTVKYLPRKNQSRRRNLCPKWKCCFLRWVLLLVDFVNDTSILECWKKWAPQSIWKKTDQATHFYRRPRAAARAPVNKSKFKIFLPFFLSFKHLVQIINNFGST